MAGGPDDARRWRLARQHPRALHRLTVPAAGAYFRVAYGRKRVWLYSGVAQDLLGTPYFVVRREGVDVVR